MPPSILFMRVVQVKLVDPHQPLPIYDAGFSATASHLHKPRANGPGDGVRTRNRSINSRVLCQIELRRDEPISQEAP